MNTEEFAEFFAKRIVEPIAPKPLIDTREERIKREYAPVIGDYGWLVTVQKDETGKLVMKCPAIVELVSGERVCLKSKSGNRIGWTNLHIEKGEDGYSDFFYNLSGYWRCVTMDFATEEDIEKAFPGTEYCFDGKNEYQIRGPGASELQTYDRRAELRIIGWNLAQGRDFTGGIE